MQRYAPIPPTALQHLPSHIFTRVSDGGLDFVQHGVRGGPQKNTTNRPGSCTPRLWSAPITGQRD